jgi:hypothetical protein
MYDPSRFGIMPAPERIHMKKPRRRAFLARLLLTAGALSVPSVADAADVSHNYRIIELRRPDSPKMPLICSFGGLSENDLVTGHIRDGEDKSHWFILENGTIRDLRQNPQGNCVTTSMSADGTAMAIESDGKHVNSVTQLYVYSGGKVRNITPRGTNPWSTSSLSHGGEFLLHSSGSAPGPGMMPSMTVEDFPTQLLCSVNNAPPISVPTGVLVGSSTVVGVLNGAHGEDLGHAEIFVQVKGRRTVLREFKDVKPGITTGNHGNEAGQAVYAIMHKKDPAEVYVVDTGKMQVLKIPELAGSAWYHVYSLWMDDQGAVVGEVGSDPPDPGSGAHAPDTQIFLFRDGKTIALGDLVANAKSILRVNGKGTIYGMTGDGKLFRLHEGKATLMDVGGRRVSIAAINDEGDAVGLCALTPGGRETHAIGVFGGKVVDLNGRVPEKSEFTLFDAVALNNRGTLVAHGYSGPLTSPRPPTRTFVLFPESAATTPAGAP